MKLATTRHGKKAHVFVPVIGSTFCGLSEDNSSLVVFMEDFDPETERVDCKRCQAALDQRPKPAAADDPGEHFMDLGRFGYDWGPYAEEGLEAVRR